MHPFLTWVRWLLYCFYSSLGRTIKPASEFNPTLETAKGWGKYVVPLVCVLCHQVSLNPSVPSAFKDGKTKGLTGYIFSAKTDVFLSS